MSHELGGNRDGSNGSSSSRKRSSRSVAISTSFRNDDHGDVGRTHTEVLVSLSNGPSAVRPMSCAMR